MYIFTILYSVVENLNFQKGTPMNSANSMIIGIVSIPDGERMISLLRAEGIDAQAFPQNPGSGG
jgi:hypothetical protein